MNNFFYTNSDYDLFKKALRSTKNEPVVINILSSDSSLSENSENTDNVNGVRKQMSSKFQASPFDKFFGPRKKRTDPLDMKDFSSWRNKNFRESEKQIDESPEEETKFSFSDYLNSRTKGDTFNSDDKIKSELQKPIDQLSSSDEDYKRFSLDSYLTKLEQESKVKKDFETTEDLIDSQDDLSMKPASDQDENFAGNSDIDVEDVALGDGVSGEKFAFDREELDTVKARLEKMERENNNIKDKPTTKVISDNDITELTGASKDDEFNLDKLGIEDDIERVNAKIDSLNKVLQVTGDDETDAPKVEHKRFVEINKNFDDSETDEKPETIDETKDETKKSESESDVVDKSENETEKTEESSDSDKEESREGVVKPVKIDGAVAESDDGEESEKSDEDGIVDEVTIPEENKESDETNNEESGEVEKSELNKKDDYLTKTDFKNITDEIINKFSEMYGSSRPNQPVYDEFGNPIVGNFNGQEGSGNSASGQNGTIVYGSGSGSGQGGGQTVVINGNGQPDNQAQVAQFSGSSNMSDGNQGYGQSGVIVAGQGGDVTNEKQLYEQQNELQSKILELIEQNKRSDDEIAQKLHLSEMEKQRVAEQYENRLRELEASIQKREEAVKQQAYIERLKNDIKFKKSESKHKLREEQIRESEKLNSENNLASEKLKSELKNSLNVSNLEMDKKLLECVNKLHKSIEDLEEKVVTDETEETEEVRERPRRASRTSRARTSQRRKTSTVKSRMRTRTPRRKIDSDIIGGINFD